MANLRKALVVSVMSITVLSMSMLAVPFQVGATAQAGDLIKMDGLSSVYYLGADGKRYVFPNESTYFSWYSDFSRVVTIPQSELESYNLGSNVTMRPGTKLVKITTSPKVYAVEAGGKLLEIPSEETAKALWGNDWAKRVVDVADAFFTNYDITGDEVEADAYPAGSLVKFGGDDVYYIAANGDARKVTGDAFEANRFQNANVVSATMARPSTGSTVSGVESGLADTAQKGLAVNNNNSGSGMTVGLASDTPQSQNVPQNVSVEMLKFRLTAANDGDVEVSTITLTAAGLGASSEITNITLYNEDGKLGRTKSTMSSNDDVTFNISPALVIEAGQTEEITVKATLTGTNNYSLEIVSASDIAADGAAISGAFPVEGNVMSGVDAGDLGEITLDAEDNDENSQIGADEVSVAIFKATADHEDVTFSAITLKNKGNLNDDEMGTFVLKHDDEEIATAEMRNDYITFEFDDVLIEEDKSEEFEVFADFEGGSAGDTLKLVVDSDSDVTAEGKKGYTAAVVYSAFDTDDADSTEITLEAGDLVMNFNTSAVPAKDIMNDTTGVVLGRLELTAPSEAIKVTGLDFTISGTNFEEPRLVGVANYSGTIDLNATTHDTDEEIFIAEGETVVFDVTIDVQDDATDGEEFYVTLAKGGVTAEGDQSETTIEDKTPSQVDSKKMTVVASGLSHDTLTLADVTAIAGNNELVKVYKGKLKAATASDITVTKIKFVDNSTANPSTSDFNEDDVNSVELVVNGDVIETETDITVTDGAVNSITFNNDFDVLAGETVQFYVKLNFSSSAEHTTDFALAVDTITAKDDEGEDVTVTEDTTTGSTVTLASAGKLDVTMSLTERDANKDSVVTAGKTSQFMGVLQLDAQDENVIIEDLVLSVATTSTRTATKIIDTIAEVQLVAEDKTTVLETTTDVTVDTAGGGVKYTFEDWNYEVQEAGIEDVYVRVKTIEIGDGVEQVATSGTTVNLAVSSVVAAGVSGEDITMTARDTAGAFTDATSDYLTTASKTVTNAGVSVSSIVSTFEAGTLTNSNQIIGKFKFTIDAGENTNASTGESAEFNFADVAFITIASSSGVTASNIQAYWASNESSKFDLDALSGLEGISESDTLVVEATIAGASDNDTVQTVLTLADLDWTDGTSATAITGVTLGYSEVKGEVIATK